MPVRLSKCSVGEKEKQAVAAVLESAYLGMGKEVKLFEEEIQKFLETDAYVVCVNTGTSALHLALLALDIGPGDEVLVPSITFVASYQAISATGAKPISCDVHPDNAFIDLSDAETRITKNTKAIMSVHYASDSSRQDDVNAFARKHGIRVVEDAAHSFGSRRNGKMVGSVGDILCFSFDGIKNITSGEGGAVVTNDETVAERIRDARLLGVEKDTEKRYSGQRSWLFDVNRQGFRFHMSNIMAAIGLTQLSRSQELFSKRKAHASRYLNELGSLPGITPLKADYENIVPHVFVIRADNRDALKEHLQENGVDTGVHYFPNHKLSMYKASYDLPGADKFYEQTLTLPLHPDLTHDEVSQVINAIKSFTARAK